MFLLPVLVLWLTIPQQRFVTASGIVTFGLSSCFTEVRTIASVQAPQPLLFRVQGPCASSHAELPTGVCYSIGMRSATPRMREYLNLQSFPECPQHPFPTFISCDHLMSYYIFFVNYLHDLSSVFPCGNLSYLKES